MTETEKKFVSSLCNCPKRDIWIGLDDDGKKIFFCHKCWHVVKPDVVPDNYVNLLSLHHEGTKPQKALIDTILGIR